MPRCYRNGYLIDATRPLPVDPSEHDVDYLPTIGCSRLRCRRCGAQVRNGPGLAFASKDDVDAGTLARLYDLPDLLQSPLIHRTSEEWRLYLCRCNRWLAVGDTALEPPDPDDSPGKPWLCEEHPTAALPHEFAGAHVANEQDLRDLTRRGLHGEAPPETREVDREAAYWLLRLYTTLESRIAAVMPEVAASTLEDSDPSARSASLRFLFFTATDAMRETVLGLLQHKRPSLDAKVDGGLTKVDKRLEDTAWRVVARLVGTEGPAREFARREAIEGRGTRAVYDALAAYDNDWLLSNIEDIARAAPVRASDLSDSFVRLPADKRSAKHAARVRVALIGDNAPVEAIRDAIQDLAKRLKRDVPAEGPMQPLKVPLPGVTGLELEINAAAATGRDRRLDLRVAGPDGTWVTRTLERGTRVALVSFLNSDDAVDVILFNAVEARR